MTKRLLELAHCVHCPNRNLACDGTYFCDHDSSPKDNIILPGFSGIPEWCPLPKAKEDVHD
jgi:hypothetical protein